MRQMTDLFLFLGFTVASLIFMYFVVQGIKAIGNFVVRRKARAEKKSPDQD